VRISYRDNGTWTEQAPGASSLGLELIENFVDQFDGQLVFEKDPATSYVITFHYRD